MSTFTDHQAGATSDMKAPPEALPADKVIVELGHSVQFHVDLSLSEREKSLLQGLKTWHEASVHSGIVLGQPM